MGAWLVDTHTTRVHHDMLMSCIHMSDALMSCGMHVNCSGQFNGGLLRFGPDISVSGSGLILCAAMPVSFATTTA